VANDVGDSHIRRRKFLDKTRIAADPFDWRQLTVLLQYLSSVSRDRAERIVVNFRPGDDWYTFVQQIGQQTNDPALCLSAKPEQDHVVSRQDGIDQLWNHRVLVTNNAGKQLFTCAEFSN